jgi:5'-3' exonuclease
MQPLIDADVICYEVGFAAEAGWKKEGFPPFDYVEEILVNRINRICMAVGATSPPILYLTGKSNFRNAIAKTTPYKARIGLKPWHYKNIKAYINCVYDVRLTEGLEADDLMAIESVLRPDEVIICSRDKDLLNFPGWKYSWELGEQPEIGPLLVDGFGEIRLSSKGKLKGYGDKFFYAQCLMGDRVDSIPGIPRTGDKTAYELLAPTEDAKDALRVVLEAYRAHYREEAEEKLLEQGRLLHMTRRLHPDGKPVLWEIPIDNV